MYCPFAQRVNVHGLALNEMFNATFNLRRAAKNVWAIKRGFAFDPHQFSSTLGAPGDIHDRFCIRVALLTINSSYFWNNLSALFNKNIISDMEIQPRDFICIMQRGTFNSGTRQEDGFKLSNRCHSASSSYLITNAVEPCAHILSLIFVSYCPSRAFCRVTQELLLFQVIHLDHYPVSFQRKFLAFCFPMIYIF